MAANLSKADALAPIVTFISAIVLGIIISEFIVKNEALQLPIILFSFFVGMLVGALELRAAIGRRRMEVTHAKKTKLTDEEAKNKLARYVADLFEEDIPFDEIDAEQQAKLDALEADENSDEDTDSENNGQDNQ